MRMPSDGQRTHRRLATRAGALDLDVEVLDALLLAARPADSAATWAAKGVDLREPLKPWPPTTPTTARRPGGR
jgi:hypothetical protein